MDILPTNTLSLFATSFKLVIFIVGVMIVAINYFHTKEARKMERKLSIELPGSVNLALSFQMILSVVFLFAATIILFLF